MRTPLKAAAGLLALTLLVAGYASLNPVEAASRHRRHSGIASGRATEIQKALIRAHYLSGSPSGHWDSATEAAMKKYQADNGWQSKIAPDSRALIKLGLGPKRDQGEYASRPRDASKSSHPRSKDTIRTLAESVMPKTQQN